MERARTVDEYLENAKQWQSELTQLREILSATALREEVKWGGPCYTYKGKNVVGIGGFKSYFGLWFHQGALLADDAKVLVNAQQGKTKALRQWRMNSAKDIKPSIIRRYAREAMQLVDGGKQLVADRDKPVHVPVELTRAMRRSKGATAAYRALTKGRQREYADYISNAKRSETKQRRIEKILPMILAGVGLNDRYRGC